MYRFLEILWKMNNLPSSLVEVRLDCKGYISNTVVVFLLLCFLVQAWILHYLMVKLVALTAASNLAACHCSDE